MKARIARRPNNDHPRLVKRRSARCPDEPALLGAIDRIYATVLDPMAWQDALVNIGQVLGADAGVLQVTGPSGVGYVGLGVYPEYGRAYVEHFAAVDQYQAVARTMVKPGDLLFDYQVIPPDQLPGTELFEDYLRPQGVFGAHNSVIGILRNDEHGIAHIQMVCRHRPIGADALRSLGQLLPHIRRAVDIQARMGEARLAEATLDRLQFGVVILDSCGCVVRVSRTAAQILNTRDGLELRARKLQAASHAEHVALERLVARTAEPALGNGGPGGALAIQRPSGRRPLSLVASPIPPAATLFSASPGAAIILFISDPELGPAAAPAETLSALYGLTPGEARTALLVANGRTPREVAEVLGITLSTVRTVLKRVFFKTGVDRQAALVRLLARTLPPLGT